MLKPEPVGMPQLANPESLYMAEAPWGRNNVFGLIIERMQFLMAVGHGRSWQLEHKVRAPHILEDQGAEIQYWKLAEATTIIGPLSVPPS